MSKRKSLHTYFIISAGILVAAIVIAFGSHAANKTAGNDTVKTSPLAIPGQSQQHLQGKPQASNAKPTTPENDNTPQWHSVTIKHADSLDMIFRKLKIPRKDLRNLLATNGLVKKYLHHLQTGSTLKLLLAADNQLLELRYQLSILTTLVAKHTDHGFIAEIIQLPIVTKTNYSAAIIHHTLLKAGLNAGLSRNLIFQLAHIFHDKINFSHQVHSGDWFQVLYQAHYVNNKKVDDGAIVAARFHNKKTTVTAIRFLFPNGSAQYYTPQGKGLRMSFLRFPVHYTYISSKFSYHRFDPIAHRYQPHLGVDLAAPIGTPIHAAADGKIILYGRDHGYGNAVEIKHSAKYTTLYGHLSRFVKGLHDGSEVKQGEIIGYVGMTGMATGPHLHYEIHVNGKPENPLTVALPQTLPLPSRYRRVFRAEARNYEMILNKHPRPS